MPLPDRDSEAHSRLFGSSPNREINGDKSKKCLFNNGRNRKMMNAPSSMEGPPPNENHHSSEGKGFPYIDDNHHSEGKGFHCIVILIVIGDDLWHLTNVSCFPIHPFCGTENPICSRTLQG